MLLSVTLPTRKRPALLRQALEALTSLARDKERTIVSLAIDADDERTIEKFASIGSMNEVKIIATVESRELTLGAKYNRAVAAAPADIYVQHADDQAIQTEDWDGILRDYIKAYDDPGCPYLGNLYFGQGAGLMPANMVISEPWRKALGNMFPAYFPNWWHETWNDDIGWMLGRNLRIPDLKVENLGGRGKVMAMRDVNFWADFFRRSQPKRVEIANRILDMLPERQFRKIMLTQQAPQLYQMLFQREEHLLVPETEEAIHREMAAKLEPGDAESLDEARRIGEAQLTEWGL